MHLSPSANTIASALTALLTTITLANATPSDYLTVTVVRIFGVPQNSHNLGPGYIPISVIDKEVRFAFAGMPEWDRECLEAKEGQTENGKLVGTTGSCAGWQKEAVWKWDMQGRIVHSDTRCMDLSEPQSLIDAPELGVVNLVEFWTCTGQTDQQWVALKNTHKIASVAKPNLCLSPLGDTGLVGAVECKDARDMGLVIKRD